METTFKRFWISGILIVVAFTQSCAPPLARVNARIEKGFQLGLAGAYTSSAGGTTDTTVGDTAADKQYYQGEIDLQYGGRKESNLGFAAQIKLGVRGNPALDLYLEGPSGEKFFYGVGVEIGYMPAVYAIGTYYLTDTTFLTITGRVLTWDTDRLIYNPQLAMGWEGEKYRPTISIFTGYQFVPTGFDVALCWDSCDNDYANHMIYAGASARF